MAKRDDIFPSKYLKASDLLGKPFTATIVSAPTEKMKTPDGKEEAKTVLYFRGAKKVLPLNRTNWDSSPTFVARIPTCGRAARSSSTRLRRKCAGRSSPASACGRLHRAISRQPRRRRLPRRSAPSSHRRLTTWLTTFRFEGDAKCSAPLWRLLEKT